MKFNTYDPRVIHTPWGWADEKDSKLSILSLFFFAIFVALGGRLKNI
jgi:hypothetical protein